jgi:acyl carrier protein
MVLGRVRSALVESIAELTRSSASRIGDGDDLVEDLGVDSMVVVNLLMTIEDNLGVRLPEGCESSLVGARTVADLTDRLMGVLADVEGGRGAAPSGSSP